MPPLPDVAFRQVFYFIVSVVFIVGISTLSGLIVKRIWYALPMNNLRGRSLPDGWFERFMNQNSEFIQVTTRTQVKIETLIEQMKDHQREVRDQLKENGITLKNLAGSFECQYQTGPAKQPTGRIHG